MSGRFVLEVAAPLLALLPGLLLLPSAVAVLHPQGRRRANVVAGVLGAGLIMLSIGLRSLVLAQPGTPVGVAAGIALLWGAQGGLVVIGVFVAWGVLTLRIRRRPPHEVAAIVVLGAGLVGRRVTSVLAERLLAALHLRERLGSPPVVVSGGRGPDEEVTEAAAMADYLRSRGLAADAILLEDASTSTRENLVGSAAIVGRLGRPGPLVVVTNGFHVVRTRAIARSLGIDVVVIGCRTPPTYLSRGLAREVVALVALHPVAHLVVATLLAATGLWWGHLAAS